MDGRGVVSPLSLHQPTMSEISREQLECYLDDALGDAETARIEQALRGSPAMQKMLRALMQERDRGEHSLGAIWRRQRLSCPTRDQLGSYLLQALLEAEQDYVEFHLKTVACAFCLANLADLQTLHKEPAPKARDRRRRIFESSAGYLHVCRPNKT